MGNAEPYAPIMPAKTCQTYVLPARGMGASRLFKSAHACSMAEHEEATGVDSV